MLDNLLRALQHSDFANWVQQVAYPIVITAHSIGLATLVGLLVVIDLRVLGFAAGLPLTALRRFMSVVWTGFWVNAISGFMLFAIDAKKDYYSTLFRLKLSLIAVGLILGSIITSQVLKREDLYAAPGARAPATSRALAVVSLCCWTSAIVTGRLLAYFTYGDIGVDD